MEFERSVSNETIAGYRQTFRSEAGTQEIGAEADTIGADPAGWQSNGWTRTISQAAEDSKTVSQSMSVATRCLTE